MYLDHLVTKGTGIDYAQLLSSIMDATEDYYSSISSIIKVEANEVFNANESFSELASAAKEKFINFIKAIKNFISTILEKLKGFFVFVIDSIKKLLNKVRNKQSNAKESAEEKCFYYMEFSDFVIEAVDFSTLYYSTAGAFAKICNGDIDIDEDNIHIHENMEEEAKKEYSEINKAKPHIIQYVEKVKVNRGYEDRFFYSYQNSVDRCVKRLEHAKQELDRLKGSNVFEDNDSIKAIEEHGDPKQQRLFKEYAVKYREAISKYVSVSSKILNISKSLIVGGLKKYSDESEAKAAVEEYKEKIKSILEEL